MFYSTNNNIIRFYIVIIVQVDITLVIDMIEI